MPELERRSGLRFSGKLVFTAFAALAAAIGFVASALELYDRVGPVSAWFPSQTPHQPDQLVDRQVSPPARKPRPDPAPGLPTEPAEDPRITQGLGQPDSAPPGIPSLTRYDILIGFAPYAVASPQSGVEIARLDPQSKLDGWLCVHDRLVMIDGVPLQGNSGEALQSDLVRKLQASPNFVVHFKPAHRSREIEFEGGLGVVRGWKVFQNLAQKRLC
jgi:hypothetical protein